MPEGSYTTYLFEQGLDKILKKVGEESAETIIAAKNGDSGSLINEVSDLIYHLLVMLVEQGVDLGAIERELGARAGGRR
jgi:phosphoribosyl-ATP pyrophosphohydrolase